MYWGKGTRDGGGGAVVAGVKGESAAEWPDPKNGWREGGEEEADRGVTKVFQYIPSGIPPYYSLLDGTSPVHPGTVLLGYMWGDV